MKSWVYKNFTIYQFSELDSTSDKAFQMADAKEIFDREIILADSQNSGRGRLLRKWISPQGNLYFSLVLKPKVTNLELSQLSFVGIVALRLAIEEVAPNLLCENKWPNDLLIEGKKVAGLLLESKISQQNCEFATIGIGVNIESSPCDTIFLATNLRQFQVDITPEDLLRKFLEKFDTIYQNWLSFGFANIRKLWLAKAFCFQEEIKVKQDNVEIFGIFEDLDLEGALILRVENKVIKICSADVFKD